MRNPALFLASLVVSCSAWAEQPCNQESIGKEDISIMASARPQAVATKMPTRFASARKPPAVLWSMADPYGRLTEEDLTQIRSVQPEGPKVVYCLSAKRPSWGF